MKKKLFQIIGIYFPDFDINKDNWQKVINNCSLVPSCHYLYSMTEYYTCYHNKNDSINLSFVINDNNESVGIMPLIVWKNEKQEWVLTSNQTTMLEPIFIKSLTRNVKKRILKNLKDLIFELAKILKINKCHFTNISVSSLSNWYLMWAEIAMKGYSSHHICVDLSLSLDDIRLEFRKSFKPLINKGLREWKVNVYEKISNEIFDSFRLLHRSLAGRATRPIESWQIQKNQINVGEAFLVLVFNKEDTLVGGGLFSYTKDKGSYSVGAYNRELSNEPLGHIVQMKAIETFKKKKVKWYEIGNKYFNIDLKGATKKQKLISHFFEGFATDVISRQNLIIDLNTDNYDNSDISC